jgi:hypothetical protein
LILSRYQILGDQLDGIINIGAAESYYAIGLALSTPGTRGIVAFEAQELGRQLLQELAAANSVKNVDIRALAR